MRSLYDGAITAVEASSSRAFSRHVHNEFGIGLITAGAQRSWSGRGQVEAVAGNVITVNPAEAHDGAAVGAARSWSMLYLSEQMVNAATADLQEGRCASQELRAPVFADQRLAWMFVATRAAAFQLDETAAFEERLAMLLAGLFGIVFPAVTCVAAGLWQVRERINDAPERPHGLAELAALAGLSRYQTIRGFAHLTGLTPHA